MKRILIISVTTGNNFLLAKNISNLLSIKSEIIRLEDYKLPLYNGKVNLDNKIIIEDLCDKVIRADGFIFCGPEYNGGSAPMLINAITWISVTTDYWRDAFFNKICLIATHSGGDGSSFLSTFRTQLEFLGVTVFPGSIKVNKKEPFRKDLVRKTIARFENLF